MIQSVSTQTLQRLPIYLHYLKSLSKTAPLNISAKQIADALGQSEIQVRKDLASVSNGGKPKIGYITEDLIHDLEAYLGYDCVNDAVLVGAGKLGKALLLYDGFKEYGLNIVAGFDINVNTANTIEGGKQILPLDKLENLCKRMNIRIGIITVPAECAQSVCDMMVSSGIEAIWSFAPTHLNVPENILVKTENMAVSLALLSKHLSERLYD